MALSRAASFALREEEAAVVEEVAAEDMEAERDYRAEQQARLDRHGFHSKPFMTFLIYLVGQLPYSQQHALSNNTFWHATHHHSFLGACERPAQIPNA